MINGPACAPLVPHGIDPLDPLDAELVATKVCPQCPVQDACLTAARREPDPVGVWGGLEFGMALDFTNPTCSVCGEDYSEGQGIAKHEYACVRRERAA